MNHLAPSLREYKKLQSIARKENEKRIKRKKRSKPSKRISKKRKVVYLFPE